MSYLNQTSFQYIQTIVRYKDVAAQIDKRKESIDKFAEGIFRFVIGLAKKIILANGIGMVADEIFNAPYQEHMILTAWLGDNLIFFINHL